MSVASSANISSLPPLGTCGKSFTSVLNSFGPRIDPCGTPYVISSLFSLSSPNVSCSLSCQLSCISSLIFHKPGVSEPLPCGRLNQRPF